MLQFAAAATCLSAASFPVCPASPEECEYGAFRHSCSAAHSPANLKTSLGTSNYYSNPQMRRIIVWYSRLGFDTGVLSVDEVLYLIARVSSEGLAIVCANSMSRACFTRLRCKQTLDLSASCVCVIPVVS